MVRQEPRKRVQKRRAKRHISTTKAETTTQPETSAQSLIRKAVKVTVVVGNQQKKTKEDPTPLSVLTEHRVLPLHNASKVMVIKSV